MKSQRLGLVLGMNVAVACLVMQGCKVTRPGEDNLPPPALDPAVSSSTTTTVVEPEPAPAPKTSTISVSTEPEPEKPAALPPPAPSKVAQVKPLPPPAAKKPAKPAKPAAAPAPAGSSTVVVQRGDTLSGICLRNHVKQSAVVAANPGLDPNRIRVGQKLVLPVAAPTAAVAATKPVAPAAKDGKVMPAAANLAANTTPPPVKTKSTFKPYTGSTKAYKVRSGDSLGKIAYENGITIRALKDMNKLTKDSIRVGQELQIPAEKVVAEKPAPAAKAAAPEAKKDAVKKDAAAKTEVAKKDEAKKPFAKKAEVEKPAESTALSNAVEKTTEAAPAPEAPKADAAASASAPAAETPAPETSGNVYVAKEGDDIVSIAIMYSTAPGRLLDLNDLKAGDPIKPGQVIKLPANAKLADQ